MLNNEEDNIFCGFKSKISDNNLLLSSFQYVFDSQQLLSSSLFNILQSLQGRNIST